MSNLNTIQNRILMAKQYEDAITTESNTYVGIGRPIQWPNDDGLVLDPIETSNAIFEVYRNLVGVKKITGSDTNLVVPRIDWVNNTVYSEYTEDLESFSYETKQIFPGNVSTQISSSNVIGNGTTFTSNISVGSYIVVQGNGTLNYPKIKKEVISVTNDTFMIVNSSFTSAYVANSYYKSINNYPNYSNKFYVRNLRDQVFKCLVNNNGAASTVMPEIDVGGSLPENQFIMTSDGYKWKYLYTIPSGLKEKFFTSDWMPVVNDNIVTNSSADGRLDIIKIFNGGSGYLNGGNSVSANIINVIGDGTGANITAVISSGSITDVNILNPGTNYTRAKITFDTTLGGVNANLVVVVGPQGGHGSDVERELGATNLMICAELDGNEGGIFPTENSQEIFDYRQISLLKNIKEYDGPVAIGSKYNATYVVTTTTPGGFGRFYLDDIIYQGDSYETATFTGVVAFWDENNDQVWINNPNGTLITEGSPSLSTYSGGINPTVSVTILGSVAPEIELYSGQLLYVKNSEPILRDDDQLEQIKLIVSF